MQRRIQRIAHDRRHQRVMPMLLSTPGWMRGCRTGRMSLQIQTRVESALNFCPEVSRQDGRTGRFRFETGSGAGDEVRTRDILLGRQALYH